MPKYQRVEFIVTDVTKKKKNLQQIKPPSQSTVLVLAFETALPHSCEPRSLQEYDTSTEISSEPLSINGWLWNRIFFPPYAGREIWGSHWLSLCFCHYSINASDNALPTATHIKSAFLTLESCSTNIMVNALVLDPPHLNIKMHESPITRHLTLLYTGWHYSTQDNIQILSNCY